MISFTAFIKKQKRLRRFEAMNRSILKQNSDSSQSLNVDHIITGNHKLLQNQ